MSDSSTDQSTFEAGQSDASNGQSSSSAGQPSDTMRERAAENTTKLWLLLDANRWLVAGVILAVVFVGFLGLGLLHPSPVREMLRRGDPMETLHQALVGSTITGVTLVLTLSQLVLSQELGAVGDQRQRMDEAMTFRKDVEDLIDADVSPATPSAFLRSLVNLTQRRAEELQEAIEEIDDEELNEQVSLFIQSLKTNAQTVSDGLEGAQFGEFDVVWSALNYNYSWKIYAARRLRAIHEDTLTDRAREEFDELIEALKLFGPAREHFKTLYFQWELIDLSRTMLYAALPALVVSMSSLVFLDMKNVVGATLGIPHALILAALTVTIALLPFAILLSYILRIITVTKRTLSIGPFILRETDRTQEIPED